MKKLIVALGILAFTAPAFAETADFATADADGNGMVSMDELKAAMPDVAEDAAMAADTDGDGSLNADEYAALANAG